MSGQGSVQRSGQKWSEVVMGRMSGRVSGQPIEMSGLLLVASMFQNSDVVYSLFVRCKKCLSYGSIGHYCSLQQSVVRCRRRLVAELTHCGQRMANGHCSRHGDTVSLVPSSFVPTRHDTPWNVADRLVHG